MHDPQIIKLVDKIVTLRVKQLKATPLTKATIQHINALVAHIKLNY